MVFWGLFTVGREEKRLIKHGRTASHTLRLRYRPNNEQSAAWCPISLNLWLSHSFLPHFSLPTPSASFSLPASLLRSDFAPPSRLEKLVKEQSFIPMSGLLICQGEVTFPDSRGEEERGWRRERSLYNKEGNKPRETIRGTSERE